MFNLSGNYAIGKHLEIHANLKWTYRIGLTAAAILRKIPATETK
jgi:hypothetical protein